MPTMMTRLLLGLAALAVAAGTASSQTPPPSECRLQAKDDHNICRQACREAFQVDKDNCRNCLHSFAEGCRASRAMCVDPFEETLEACLGVCRTEIKEDKIDCAPGDDACIDAAQLEAFGCRDLCRENQTVRDGIKNCRQIFRACMQQCPPAN